MVFTGYINQFGFQQSIRMFFHIFPKLHKLFMLEILFQPVNIVIISIVLNREKTKPHPVWGQEVSTYWQHLSSFWWSVSVFVNNVSIFANVHTDKHKWTLVRITSIVLNS